MVFFLELKCNSQMNVSPIYTTVVGDNINTMKTTFDLNFDLFQAV